MEFKHLITLNKDNIFLVYSESNMLLYWTSTKTNSIERFILNKFTDEIEYFKIFKKNENDYILVLLKNKLFYIFIIVYSESDIKQLEMICYTEILKNIDLKLVKNIQFFPIEKETFYLYFVGNIFHGNITIISIFQEKNNFQIEIFNYKYPDFGNINIAFCKESGSTFDLIIEQTLSHSYSISKSNFIKLYLKTKEKDILIDESNILTLSFDLKVKITKNCLIYLKNYILKFVLLDKFTLISSIDCRTLWKPKESSILSIDYKLIKESLIIFIITNDLIVKILTRVDTFKIESSEKFIINPHFINLISSKFVYANENLSRYVIISENLCILSFDFKGKKMIENSFDLKHLKHLKHFKKLKILQFLCLDLMENTVLNFSDEMKYVCSGNQSEFIYFAKYTLSKSNDTIIKLKSIFKEIVLEDIFFYIEVVNIFLEDEIIVIKVVFYYKIITHIVNFKGDLLFSIENEVVKVDIKDNYIFCLTRNFLQVHDQHYKVVFSLNLENSKDMIIDDKKLFIIDLNSVKILTINKERIISTSEYNFQQTYKFNDYIDYLYDSISKIFVLFSNKSCSIFLIKEHKIKEIRSNLNNILIREKENNTFVTLIKRNLFILKDNTINVYTLSVDSGEYLNFELRYIFNINNPIKIIDFSALYSKHFILFFQTKKSLLFLSFTDDYKNYSIEHVNDYFMIAGSTNIYKKTIKKDELFVEFRTLLLHLNSKDNKVPKKIILKDHCYDLINPHLNSFLFISRSYEEENNKEYMITNSLDFEVFMDIKLCGNINLIDVFVNKSEKLLCLILQSNEDKSRKLVILRYVKGSSETSDKLSQISNNFSLKFIDSKIKFNFSIIIDIDSLMSRVLFIEKLSFFITLSNYGKIKIYEICGKELISLYESFYSFSKSELKEMNIEYSDETDLINLFNLDNELNFLNKYIYFDYIYIPDNEINGIEESFILLIFNHGCVIFSILQDIKIKSYKKIKFFQQYSLENVETKFLNKLKYLNKDKNCEILLVYENISIKIIKEYKKFSFSYFNQ